MILFLYIYIFNIVFRKIKSIKILNEIKYLQRFKLKTNVFKLKPTIFISAPTVTDIPLLIPF